MTSAWFNNGAAVTDANGAVVLCDQCPCDQPPPPCCVGTTPQHFWVYLSFATYRTVGSTDRPPYGCSALALCANVAGSTDPAAQDHYNGHQIVDFWFNTGDTTPIIKSFAGCWPIRIRNTCVLLFFPGGVPVYQPNTFIGIDYLNDGDFSDEVDLQGNQSNLTNPCHLPNLGCIFQIVAPDGFYTTGYLVDYDPTEGIHTISDGTVPITITFHITLTNLGHPIPYSCDLTFSPGDTFLASGTPCLQWVGCFADCVPRPAWVELWYDGTNWTLLISEDAMTGFPADNFHTLYQGTTFPTFGTGDIFGSIFLVCDDNGTTPPWSVLR